MAGAIVLLIPFHTALEMDLFYILIGLGLGGLLLGSWGPLVGKFLLTAKVKKFEGVGKTNITKAEGGIS